MVILVFVTVWFLEHTQPTTVEVPNGYPGTTHLIRLTTPPPGLALLYYEVIGGPCRWRSRLSWDADTWARELARTGHEWWLFWSSGRPVGFTEMHGGTDDDRAATHIKYLGLIPEARGRGLGARLVAEAVRQAGLVHLRHPGLPEVARVTVTTTARDSAPALPNYRARGFKTVRTELRRAD